MSTAAGTITYKLGTIEEYNFVLTSIQGIPNAIINSKNISTRTIKVTFTNLTIGTMN